MPLDLKFPLHNDISRKIIHIDMDAFYASVEERDHPEYVGKPLVIARHPKDTGGKGVVTTANYEARKFGIHSAMSAQKAYELCPHATFVSAHFDYYREISQQIRQIFLRYTDLFEPMSLDEAYLDVTENNLHSKSAIKIAKSIQYDIWSELHLTCSAGISYNKYLAKLASDYHKPQGMTVISPEDAVPFLKKMPIEKFYGIGKKTLPRMHELQIFTGEDLLQLSEMELIQEFGKMGYSLYRKVRGIHNAPVEANRERKSIGKEHTYGRPLQTEEEIIGQLRMLSDSVSRSLENHRKKGKTVVLKMRNTEFETLTRRVTLEDYISDSDQIFFQAQLLWEEFGDVSEGIRLLGVTLTNLVSVSYEALKLPLWDQKKLD